MLISSSINLMRVELYIFKLSVSRAVPGLSARRWRGSEASSLRLAVLGLAVLRVVKRLRLGLDLLLKL